MKGTETGEKRRLFSSWFYFAENLEGNHEENKNGTNLEGNHDGDKKETRDRKHGRKEGETEWKKSEQCWKRLPRER